MNQSNWARIQEIYHAALALPRAVRPTFVAKECDQDSALARKVYSLLKSEDSLSGFLDTPVVELFPKDYSGAVQANTMSPDDLIGTIIGERYQIERKLGHGGMGQVYYALDLKLNGRPVVIKILSEELLKNSYALQKFRQEVEALSRIHHDGVVSVLDTGDLPDARPYIVMQYVDGETLRSQIQPEGMDLGRAASILKQIGAALEHVHQKGIFHRDLKPENVMLKRGTDSVVLIDFGIAKVKDSIIAPTTTKGSSVGTLLYMSPEQLREEEVAAESDIYSMGLIAYEMVTGRRPFNPNSAVQLLEMQRAGVRTKPAYLRESLPPGAQKAILRALSFAPRARYRSAKEFGGLLSTALLDSKAPTQKRWAKVIVASLMALIVVALVSWGIYLYLKRTPPAPTHSFTYWLTVQKMRDGKDYQAPFKSNGEETFENGDMFQLSVSSSEPGYLYVLNEGPPEPNDTNFAMLYPSAQRNNGSATVGAGQPVQTDSITFRGPQGNENVWFVWSVSPVRELESAKIESFKHPKGGLTADNLVAIKEFLRVNETKVRVTHYKSSQTAVVRGSGNTLITLVQFKHR